MADPQNEAWKALILDHYKNPRHFGELTAPSCVSEQHNRTCGDHVKVFAEYTPESKGLFSFTGAGCSLCLASASLMLELIQGKSREDVRQVRDEFYSLWEKGLSEEHKIDTWMALEGLRAYPVRSRCVKLAWQALDEILDNWL